MTHIDEASCRRALEELAALWPRPEMPAALSARLDACPACRLEKASFEALCAKSSSWSQALPAAHWQELARATRRALAPRRTLRPIVWAPAAAFAAAALAVLFNYRVPDVVVERPNPAAVLPPREVLENQEMLERLDLLEDWDGVKAVSQGAS